MEVEKEINELKKRVEELEKKQESKSEIKDEEQPMFGLPDADEYNERFKKSVEF